MGHRIFWLLLASSFLFLCGIIPLPGEMTGLAVGSVFFGLVVVGWPIFVGPRLHERNWQALATQSGLTYHPRHHLKKGSPPTLTGRYLNHQITLTTFMSRQGRHHIYELILTVPVNNPEAYNFSCRKLGKIDMTLKRKSGQACTGNAEFDRYFVVDTAHPEDFVTSLMATPGVGLKISQTIKGSRYINIALQGDRLTFREIYGQFGGAEADVGRLTAIIEAMCGLATATEA